MSLPGFCGAELARSLESRGQEIAVSDIVFCVITGLPGVVVACVCERNLLMVVVERMRSTTELHMWDVTSEKHVWQADKVPWLAQVMIVFFKGCMHPFHISNCLHIAFTCHRAKVQIAAAWRSEGHGRFTVLRRT